MGKKVDYEDKAQRIFENLAQSANEDNPFLRWMSVLEESKLSEEEWGLVVEFLSLFDIVPAEDILYYSPQTLQKEEEYLLEKSRKIARSIKVKERKNKEHSIRPLPYMAAEVIALSGSVKPYEEIDNILWSPYGPPIEVQTENVAGISEKERTDKYIIMYKQVYGKDIGYLKNLKDIYKEGLVKIDSTIESKHTALNKSLGEFYELLDKKYELSKTSKKDKKINKGDVEQLLQKVSSSARKTTFSFLEMRAAQTSKFYASLGGINHFGFGSLMSLVGTEFYAQLFEKKAKDYLEEYGIYVASVFWEAAWRSMRLAHYSFIYGNDGILEAFTDRKSRAN